MKIVDQDTVNTISNSRTSGVYASPKAGPSQGSGSTATGSLSSDGIDLGSRSGLISQAQSADSSARAARMEQLRALVQSGQYQVDPAALSKAIVNSALNGG